VQCIHAMKERHCHQDLKRSLQVFTSLYRVLDISQESSEGGSAGCWQQYRARSLRVHFDETRREANMHTLDNQRTHKPASTIAAQELSRNNIEVAGLIVYFFTLAMVFTIFAILMLFGSGMTTDAQTSMKGKPSRFAQPSQTDQYVLRSSTTT
jgi:hypothetical protein